MNSARRTWTVLMTLGVALLLVAQTANAQRRHHRNLVDPRYDYTQGGFQLYAGFGGQGYEIEDNDYQYLDELDSDGMFFLGAAFGLNPRTSLYIEGAGSDHVTSVGNMTFGFAHIGVKYAPNTGYRNPWQPYGKASVGAIFLLEDNHAYDCDCRDNGYVGPSLGLGVGVDRFISRRAALFGELGVLLGRFDSRIIDGEDYELVDKVGVTSGRLQFGLRFRL